MEDPEYELMDAVETTMWWYRALHRRLIDALADVTGSVLDAGCGTGGMLARIARERPDLWACGADIFPWAAARAGLKSGGSAVCASVLKLPFADGAFDAVLSADVLCHKSLEPAEALQEFSRVLKPGGRLVLNMPAFNWLLSAHDARVHNARRTTAGELRDVLTANGFGAVRTMYWNSLLLPLMILERKVLARRASAASDVKPFPPTIEAILFAVTELERTVRLRAPAGGSVLAIAHRM